MGWSGARFDDGTLLELPDGPVACTSLQVLVGRQFVLPCDDPWVLETGDSAHDYLDSARAAWQNTPEYMDFLDESSPCHALKATEHSVYMSHWSTWLEGASSVLDVGCGIGRFTLPLLDQGVTVYGVDADHESLLRCAWRAAGKAGSLALSWSSVHALPEVQVDVAIASEVLCYVPETRTALRALADRVRPGGVLLLSVEARWGWAASPDAPEGTLEAALSGDGVVDREQAWVRTMTEADVRDWIAEAELELVEVVASHYVLDGPLEQVAGEAPSLADVLTWEARCRAHPVWSPLNRLWLVVARKPVA